MWSRVVAVVLCCAIAVHACTNFLISKEASADGSTMISYAADSHTMYGWMAHFPAANHSAGDMRDIYDWESGHFLGQIPEAAHTYLVNGNMNEFGLAIAETTYGGLDALCSQPGAIIDYGSLITIALQRAKTAREAIHVIANLTAEYGYTSEGETFSLADGNEVWVMDLIGKGQGEVGIVWVARRVPAGYVCSHANEARIQTFPRDDPDNCLFADDVVDFARQKGLYPPTAPDADFSFSDTYSPVTFELARAAEARVWAFFNHVTAPGTMDPYLDYAWGHNLTHRMPLFVKPAFLLTVNDTMNFMRDHFEGTPLDFRSDVGAQAFGMPYRWRPLDWTVDGNTYINERSVGTQQTGFTFVAQTRSWLPPAIGGIQWFGMDDTATTVFAPMYAGITEIPTSFALGTGALMTFSFNSNFWVMNLVANLAYTRYSLIYPDIFDAVVAHENAYFNATAVLEAEVTPLYQQDPHAAIAKLTAFSKSTGEQLTRDWLQLWQDLFVRYMDGNVKYPLAGELEPTLIQPGYPDATYRRIVAETGTRYLEPATPSVSSARVRRATAHHRSPAKRKAAARKLHAKGI